MNKNLQKLNELYDNTTRTKRFLTVVVLLVPGLVMIGNESLEVFVIGLLWLFTVLAVRQTYLDSENEDNIE